MNNKLYFNLRLGLRAIRSKFISALTYCLICLAVVPAAFAGGDAPAWMHALVTAPLPAHDEKTNAVLLYEDINVTVVSTDKIKTRVRVALKILRPSGRDYGVVGASFNAHSKITGMRGWCIPAQGKDYEVKDKDAIETAVPKVEYGDLVDDVRVKRINIPAPDPGNIIGYEFEKEERPLVLQDEFHFQEEIPVREAHYSLQLPLGWEYKASWINYPESKPTQSGSQVQWTVNDVSAIRAEDDMPPFRGVAGHMVVSFLPPGGPSIQNGFTNWSEMGRWYWNLEEDRFVASPALKQKVAELTANQSTTLQKMQALADFVQHQIRYVAIELGIGGWQPHPAADIFAHHYGDCKDKATLMGTMLREIGVDSFQVAINTERGSITPQTPAYRGFDHEIMAIRLPADVNDPSLLAVLNHPTLGRLLFFDPTDDVTPFGQLSGALQLNYGLVIAPSGGELVELPEEAPAYNGIRRNAHLTLDALGNIKGEVVETRMGDRAWVQRWRLRTVTDNKDRIKPIEDLLAGSLSQFQITKASIINANVQNQPFGYEYSFQAENYATNAGGFLLVRPRVLGIKSRALLETKEPRKFPVEFDGPVLDGDSFEITIPAGYTVDDMPSPVDVDYGFASYHSKTEVKGNVIDYTRTFEIKELTVPLDKIPDLRKFYRLVAADERNTVVLKKAN